MGNIRLATKNDAKTLHKLYNSSKYLLEEENDYYTLADVKKYINDKINKIFVCEINGKIAGSILAEICNCYIFICIFVVDKKYRRKGIGNKLLVHIESYAKKRRINRIEMFVESSNKNMQKFVKKNNYVMGNKFIYYSKKGKI